MSGQSVVDADTSVAIEEIAVGDLLRRTVAAHPDTVALVAGRADPSTRERWTYAELLAEAERVARCLLDRADPGEHVAVWAANRPEWVVLEFGVALAGMVLVTVNPTFGEAEAEYVIGHSDAVLLFCAAEHRGTDVAAVSARIADRLPRLREVILIDDVRSLAPESPDRSLPEPRPGDPAQLQYTSGTTGLPKGVLLSHRTIANVARFNLARGEIGEGSVFLNPMPLFHTGGCVICTLGPVWGGSTHVLVEQFDPALMLELIETERVTALGSVPTMLTAMLEHPDLETRELSSLDCVMCGAAPVPAPVIRRVQDRFGARLLNLFGQTELGSTCSMTWPTDTPADKEATIGTALPNIEVRIADPVTGETVPHGTPGEYCVRGYQVMLGYYRDPEATARTIDAGGWLHTGDLCTMDERGYCSIAGRLKDMIIRGGENISPAEVEAALLEHAAVREAAVIGIPDSHWGETVAAFVNLAAENELDAVEAHCARVLARHKRPVHWYRADSLPMTASGKVQKFRLREMIADGKAVPYRVGSQ